MLVLQSRNAAAGFFDTMLGKNGNAIVALLAERLDVEAHGFEFEPGKPRIFALDFLQAPDVGVHLIEHLQRGRQPREDRVYIPGCNFEGHPCGLAARAAGFNRTSPWRRRRSRRSRATRRRSACSVGPCRSGGARFVFFHFDVLADFFGVIGTSPSPPLDIFVCPGPRESQCAAPW